MTVGRQGEFNAHEAWIALLPLGKVLKTLRPGVELEYDGHRNPDHAMRKPI